MPSRSFASFLLLSLALLASAGCTAVGFGVGALVDAGSGKGSAARLNDVHPGRNVTVWLHDGSRAEGRFLGREPVTPAPDLDPFSAAAGGAILLQTKSETMRITAGDVDRVSVPVYKGKVTGMVIGLAIDALVFFASWQALGNTNY
jgi:hypothetical protein